MNNSVLEENKSVENTENVKTLKDGSKVDLSTGEYFSSSEVAKEKAKEEETAKETTNEEKAVAPTTPAPNEEKVDDTSKEEKPVATTPKEETKELLPHEKENAMREEVSKLDLKNLDTKLMYEFMAVPTVSDYEYRMVTYLILWARKNNIAHYFDDYGNLYFVKGTPKDGEFYPCVTAHLDTVQDKQKAYVLTGAELNLKTRKNTKGQHEVYIDGIGTGSDDKNAILIALHMFEKFDVLKGSFYLGEERGCKGSNHMDASFYDDVSYVIGFDSPELNRAAWSLCRDIKLFSGEFYKTHMKPVCDKYGMTKFFSESITDEANIVKETGLTCMNFGNGGYSAHMPTEYFIVEELDHALSMGFELVETIPTNVQHFVRDVTIVKNEDGTETRTVSKVSDRSDIEFLESLGDKTKYSSYSFGGTGKTYSTGSSFSGSKSNTSDGYWDKDKSKNETEDKNSITEESLIYITEIYDERIQEIKSNIEKKCKELGLSFEDNFAEVFSEEISF